jgi:hypothetical protein
VGKDYRNGLILVIFTIQYILGSIIYLLFIGGKQGKGIGFLTKKKSLLLVSRRIKGSSSGDVRVYRRRGLEVGLLRTIEERNSVRRRRVKPIRMVG